MGIRNVVVTSLAFCLMTGTAAAQASGLQIFKLPNTGPASQWMQLGTYNASQQGYDIDVKIVSSNGFNANISQDQISHIHFKSSNADSVNDNGFAGDSWWYQTGPNTSAPSQVVWVANAAGTSATSFTLFAYFGAWTGDGSYYVVDVPPGTSWTNSSTANQTNPGAGSSTVLFARNQLYVGSAASFAGNVGIGADGTNEKLEVNGNIKLSSSGSGHHLIFSDGSEQAHAWDGVLESADYAESVDVTGERSSFEPGDLLVIDPSQHGHFQKASKPYSTLISGVYSTKPGALGRRKPRSVPKDEEVPMAMVGIVPTKVSTENGPVHDGDLLVSSSTPGYAMKGTERDRMMGSVLGKAMDSLESGKGVIEVLISLQ